VHERHKMLRIREFHTTFRSDSLPPVLRLQACDWPV